MSAVRFRRGGTLTIADADAPDAPDARSTRGKVPLGHDRWPGRPGSDAPDTRSTRPGRRGRSIPTGRDVMASAQGQVRGLRVPGPAWSGTRRHSRIDVVVAPGGLWVTGTGEVRRYAVADMVLASFADSPPGTVRVDFLDGTPLCVTLDDDGTVLEALRHEIWEFEKRLLLDRAACDGTELDWALDVSPARLAESEALLTSALDCPDDPLGTGPAGSARRDLIRRSAELRRDARVDALRRRRRRMLGGSPHGRTDRSDP